jgi:hypothetical protein
MPSLNFFIGQHVYLPVRFVDSGSVGMVFQFKEFRMIVSMKAITEDETEDLK